MSVERDDLAVMLAALDQALPLLPHIAGAVAAYRDALSVAGVGEPTITACVVDYQRGLLITGYGHSGTVDPA